METANDANEQGSNVQYADSPLVKLYITKFSWHMCVF